MRAWSKSLLAATLALAPTAGLAQTTEDPESLIHQGNQLRHLGENVRAEGYFRRAYQLAHTPRAAAQLGLVELALHQYAAAQAYLSLALIDREDAWVRENEQTLEASRTAARKHLVRLETRLPAHATVSVQGAPPESIGSDGIVWLAPGVGILRFEAEGYQPATVQVRGTEGETLRQSITLETTPSTLETTPSTLETTPSTLETTLSPPPGIVSVSSHGVAPPAPERDERDRRALRWTGIGLAAGGVVAAVIGTALVAEGNAKRDHIEAAANSGTQRYDPADGNFSTLQTNGTRLLVAAGAALVGGCALYLLGSPGHGDQRGARASLDVGGGETGVGIAGWF
jgi:hypothetical protein